eukprot:GFYU01042292.1.p1 GENE.GFYU01042292.1~~GFYU01042292.1.p1  ORF type:complete len:281 (+),score=46.28 GFYU01042292.1:38-880(+)
MHDALTQCLHNRCVERVACWVVMLKKTTSKSNLKSSTSTSSPKPAARTASKTTTGKVLKKTKSGESLKVGTKPKTKKVSASKSTEDGVLTLDELLAKEKTANDEDKAAENENLPLKYRLTAISHDADDDDAVVSALVKGDADEGDDLDAMLADLDGRFNELQMDGKSFKKDFKDLKKQIREDEEEELDIIRRVQEEQFAAKAYERLKAEQELERKKQAILEKNRKERVENRVGGGYKLGAGGQASATATQVGNESTAGDETTGAATVETIATTAEQGEAK